MKNWFGGLAQTARPRRNRSKAIKRPTHLQFERLEDRWAPAVFNVNSLADLSIVTGVNPDGTIIGQGSTATLRSAVQAANGNSGAGGNTINLTLPGTYKITLIGSPGETDNLNGEFSIFPTFPNGNLTIVNTSGGTAIVDGGHFNRVFDINASATSNIATQFLVTMQGFTITNGNAFDAANSDGPTSTGGGIRDQGNTSLTLANMVIANNVANADGGGVVMEDTVNIGTWTLTITGSTISNNHSGDAGGGVDTDGTGTVVISDSTVTGNTDVNQGAGVYIDTVAVGTTFPGASMNMTGTTVSNNQALANGVTGSGGGISNAGGGIMTITSGTISNNFSGGSGGGFSDENNVGTLVVSNSLFLANSAVADGGGIQEGGPSTTITNTAVQGNTASGTGGGLFLNGTNVSLQSSTINGNTAVGGGGGLEIQTTGPGAAGTTITNSTITADTATGDAATATTANGGGIEAPATTFTGDLTLLNDTINGNSATNGGGVFWDGSTGTFTLQNTIVAANSAGTGPDANNPSGTFTDNGGNLIGVSGAGSGNSGFTAATTQTGAVATPLDPLLGPLADNGGPAIGAPPTTQTLATELPISGSPAINKGITAGAPSVDERGFPRALTAADPPDVGAAESSANVTTVSTSPLNLQGGVDVGTLQVATFTNPSDSNPADFGVDIAWGDGLGDRGMVTFNAQTQTFTVMGSHMYGTEGFFTITVTVHPPGGAPTTMSTAVTSVADAPVFITSLQAPPMMLGATATGQTVATFADYDNGAVSADFQATIAWGDGTTSTGTVVQTGVDSFNHPNFLVMGSHTFMSRPTGPFRVTIQDLRGGAMTTMANDGNGALEMIVYFDHSTGTYKVIQFHYA